MIKKFISIIIMLFMIATLPLQAFAMAEVSVELPFAVENFNGTVVIEAVDGSPLPERTEFQDVADGTFKFSFSQPDTYRYRVYQQIPENTNGVIFDKTVYKITLTVLSDAEGILQSVCTISIDGSAEKKEAILFENRFSNDKETTTEQTTVPPDHNEQTSASPDDSEQTTAPSNGNGQNSNPSDHSTQTTLPANGTEQTTPPPNDNNNDQNSTSPNDSSQGDNAQNPTPNTGDNGNLGLWMTISVLSLAGIFVMLFAARREKVR